MKNIVNSKSFKILVTCVVILIALLIYTQSVNRSFLSNIINFISAPMQSVSSGISSNVKESVNKAKDTEDSLRSEIEQLKEENRQYRQQLVDYDECKRLVENYETVLELKKKNRDFIMISGEIIGKDASDLFYSFSVDVGSADGVYEGAPVITGDGLVGWVSQANTTTSIVTTIFSEKTQVGAVCSRTNEKGVLNSNLKFSDDKNVFLSYLDTNTEIKANDIITTTGLGGQFPKGLMIGTVISVERSEHDISKYAVIKPFVDIENIKNVFILTDFTGKGEIEKTAEPKSDPEVTESSKAEDEKTSSEVEEQ